MFRSKTCFRRKQKYTIKNVENHNKIIEHKPMPGYMMKLISNGINKASEQLTNIFDNLAKTSCKIIRHKKVKIKKKKSWSDNEVNDLKKTVVDLGNKMRSKPFDLQLRHNFFYH